MQNFTINFLINLIKKQSITPNECGIYNEICSILSDFKPIFIEKNGVKNLFLYKNFGKKVESKTFHLCFAGHIDVVPSGCGWSVEPFGGEIKDGYIFGRGAQDMKGGISAFVAAVRRVREFSGILSLLLTSDEEGEGIYGTKIMLEHLKKINLLPDFALVAEPTCECEFGDTIKIGRRGSINGVIKISGIQGHVAYPEKCKNPIDLIAPILPKLSGVLLDNGDSNFAPSKLVISDIRAGMEVCNVTPENLKIMFNVRNSTQSNKDSISNFISNVFSSVPYELELKQSSYPFIAKNLRFAKILQDCIYEKLEKKAAFSTSGGTSDARYFAEFGIEVAEFGLKNDRIHAIDECTKISDVLILEEIFELFINKINA